MSTAARTPAPRVIALVPLELNDASDPFASVGTAASIAADCGGTLDAIVLGSAPRDEDGAVAFDAGAGRVWLATQPQLAAWGDCDQLVAAFAEALAAPELDSANARLLLLPATAMGDEIAARLAMRLPAIPLGRCTAIELTEQGIAVTRPAYGGRARATLLASQGPCFATMQYSKSLTPLAPTPTLPRIAREGDTSIAARSLNLLPLRAGEGWDGDRQEITRLQLNCPLPTTEHITHKDLGERLAPVEGAKVVVCGGRGIGSAEGFALLQDLATALGGAVAGSLQAVDAGWIPVARQVGQSGKYVTADLYIGVGVSGTPQHMAGVGPHTRIVAINSDAGADIFRYAEIGIVVDWKELVQAVIDRLQQAAA